MILQNILQQGCRIFCGFKDNMNLLAFNIDYILNTLSIGGVYAIIAIGYTMVYGILRLINFAHADMFMMAGMFMISAAASFGIYVAIPATILFTAVLGIIIEKIAYKPLRNEPRMSAMVSAIAVSYFLVYLANYIWTAIPKPFPDIPFLTKQISLFGKVRPVAVIVRPIVTVLLVALLLALIKKTKFGIAMRASSKDFEAASLMGVKVNKVVSTTFAIGSALAAIGAILYFADHPQVFPTTGGSIGLKCFVAAVFGGIGSIPGAVVGGFVIAFFEVLFTSFFTQWIPQISLFSDAFTFILLIVILIVKPTGLFGEKLQEKV